MSAQVNGIYKGRNVTMTELVCYFVALALCMGFFAPALISADDNTLVVGGFLLLALMLVWAFSIVRRVWQYEDLSDASK